jgi:GNAT superfamily N-acetyltransferase
MPVEVRICSVDELESVHNLPALLDEYAQESALFCLPKPNAQMEAYRNMTRDGYMHILGAFKEGELLGFLAMLAPVLPHYGVRVATTESFFVAKEHRKTGAGLALLHFAESFARDLGAVCILVSTPTDGMLSYVLPKAGYQETNRVYGKGLQ